MIPLELKEAYNKNLKRVMKAIAYLDDPERTKEEIKANVENYRKLLNNQKILMRECGLKSGDKEVLGGFKI